MLRSPDTRDDGRDPNFMQAPVVAHRDGAGSTPRPGYSSPPGSPPPRLRPSGESSDLTSAPGRARIGAMGTYSEAAARAHAEAVIAFRARLAARFAGAPVPDDGTAWAEPAPVARRMPPPIVVLALLASVASLVLAVVELFS